MLAKWIGWSLLDVRSLEPHEHAVLVDLMTTATKPTD